jgi:large subunit ribosomal protein L15
MDISKVVGVDVGRRFKRRKGRGTGSGAGKTSSRGSKGAASRSGYGGLLHHEGGQMPLIRRIPKRGFSNSLFRIEYEAVNLDRVAQFAGQTVTIDLLKEHGLLKKKTKRFKILGGGELTGKTDIVADAFSKSALVKIEAAGGKATVFVAETGATETCATGTGASATDGQAS